MGLVKCQVKCVPAYTLSSPAFKGVTRGMNFKHYPTPCSHRHMQVPLGAWSKTKTTLLYIHRIMRQIVLSEGDWLEME